MKTLESIFGIRYADINQFLLKIGTQVLIAVAILVIGFWLTGVLTKGFKRILIKSETDMGLVTFLTSFISLGSKILVFITAISQLGIQMTSFITLLGAAGLAVGMAFSGTLSNFAGGIMILVLKPFKVGDQIVALGTQGKVTEIQIFNTYLTTFDNKLIILPNGPVANGNITNFTKAKERLVVWVFPLPYGTDIIEIRKTIERFLADDARILSDKKVTIDVQDYTDRIVNLSVKAWVKTPDYMSVLADVQNQLYSAFKHLDFQPE